MKLKLFFLVLLITVFSCSSDKQAELSKLKKQQSQIAQQIKTLESDTSLADPVDLSKVKLVVVQELEQQPFHHYIEAQGRLDGDENVGISAQVPGKLVHLPVKVGDSVHKGQLLAKLDDEVMQQQLKQMETNLEFLTEVFEKQKRLWDQHVGSEVQYLSAKNNKESLEQQIAMLKNQVETMQITSPINGAVEDISVKEGQIVNPGLPIIRVVNFDRLKVVADLSESYSDKIKTGDAVKVYFPDLRNEVNATVSFASRYINPVNRSFTVEARISSAVTGLKVNMVAVVKINDYTNPTAITVPINLIRQDRDQLVVYIAEANSSPKAKRITVKTGISYEGMAEITEGLKAGDKLITIGYQDLEDGEPVRF